MAIGTDRLLADFSTLYTNEELSDVEIAVNGVTIPAHRVILIRRCSGFKTMLENAMNEAINHIEIPATSTEGFKLVLKWIYTGQIEFESIDDAFEVLRLAKMYELTEIVNLAVPYFKRICAVEHVCRILNISVFLSLDELTFSVTDYASKKPHEILNHDSFLILSMNAINVVLTCVVMAVPNFEIFRAVVRWMKANPLESAAFPDVLKNVPLGSLTVNELTALTSDVLDANTLLDLARQQQSRIFFFKLNNRNVALRKFGAKVISGGESSFLEKDGTVLKHTIGSLEAIAMDLGNRFLINSINMQLVESVGKTLSYWIDVFEDNANWIRVIDYSKYRCRSLQRLHFEERAIRYIRICGTAPVNETFRISEFQALYTTEPFVIDPETSILVPSDNVALIEKNATVIQGSSSSMIDGTLDGYHDGSGVTSHVIGKDPIIVQLAQPYLLNYIKLLLWDLDDRVYSYYVEVSTDLITWTRIGCEKNVASWREVHFDRQAVIFIKLTGTYSSANENYGFDCVSFECCAISN